MSLDLNPVVIAFLATVFTGAGTVIAEFILNKKSKKQSADADLRSELRLTIDDLKRDVQNFRSEEVRLEGLIDMWREKYYDLLSEYQQTLTKLQIALAEIERAAKERNGEKNNDD